jgi:hypothetical protein
MTADKPACALCGSTKRVYDGEILVRGEWIVVCAPCLTESQPIRIDDNQLDIFGGTP